MVCQLTFQCSLFLGSDRLTADMTGRGAGPLGNPRALLRHEKKKMIFSTDPDAFVEVYLTMFPKQPAHLGESLSGLCIQLYTSA